MMSEFYFCIFCDTVVLSLDQLKDHLSIHFAEEGNEDQISLSDIEKEFVDTLVKYEIELSQSMALMPKELPKDNIQNLLMGCPTCDAIIRCYDLIPNRDTKDNCHCRLLPDSRMNEIFKCIRCLRLSKNFQISYLKCLSFEAQRDHCYQHLAYYPFVCQFVSQNGGQVCGQKLITIKACETHLIYDHKYCVNADKEIFEILSSNFNMNQIKKVDDLINTRLNSKNNLNISILSVESPNKCLPAFASTSSIYRNDCPSTSAASDGNQLEFIVDSDDEFDNSFHYTTEEFVKNYQKRKHLEPIGDHNYMRSHSLNESFGHNLQYIPITKKRGRPKGSKNKTSIDSQPTDLPEHEDISVPEEVVDLTHQRQYLNWFTQTKPTKFPYFPQKDDEIYYLPYGHELYKQEVMRRGLYNQSNRNFTMRFFNYHKILAKVAKIDFLFKERRRTETVIRCIYITLRPYDERYGTIIHVKYHDMEGVLDFIILKEHYEQSVQKVWQIGEHFRSIIDDKYWFGVVIGYSDAHYCQNSLFKKYHIQWLSNNTTDYLSPWDLEPIDPTVPFNKFSFAPISDADRHSFFTRCREEWPYFNEEKELQRLVKGLKVIYNMDKTREFPILQDLTDSRYLEKILYPVDMKIFISRIENRYYRRHLAIKYDIKFMEANIRKLIKSVKRDPEYRLDEAIAKRLKYHTKFVTALCLLFIDTHECRNPYDLYPNIDDYLETHDVKCYSAKRVHLNMKKKYPNCLPVPHKRLPKKPQSFGDSAKTLKIFKALSNTETLSRRYSSPMAAASTSSRSKVSKTKTTTQSAADLQEMTPFRCETNEVIPSESDEEEMPKFKICTDVNENITFAQNCDYSSDVSRSEAENEYRKLHEYEEPMSECTDDSDVDPDFQTTNYYKKHIN